MRNLFWLAAILFGMPALVLAQAATAPPPAPTAAPAPTTRPTVLILPFQQTGDNTSHAWVGSAIDENLISEASRNGAFTVETVPQEQATANATDAIRLAHDHSANVVVFGSYQVTPDQQLHVLGQITDAASASSIATLQANGALRDLFTIEDQLVTQLRGGLNQIATPANLPQVTYGTPGQPYYYPTAEPQQQQQPLQYESAPYAQPPVTAYDYAFPDNGYAYSYPDYGYYYTTPYYYAGYPYYYGYGGPFIYIGGGYYGGWYHHPYYGGRGWYGGYHGGGVTFHADGGFHAGVGIGGGFHGGGGFGGGFHGGGGGHGR